MVKYLIMDVDGTLTDGKIYMGENGEVMKAFSVNDGYAISNLLKQAHIIPVIITGRTSKIVENRCKELDITEVYQGVVDKAAQLQGLCKKYGICEENIFFIGDDLNDYACMKYLKNRGGLIGCPADAVEEIQGIADFISTKKGGAGAVRDFIEWLIRKMNDES